MDAATFFGRLADLLKDNPPAEADRPMVEKLARLGIVPVSSTRRMRRLSIEERQPGGR